MESDRNFTLHSLRHSFIPKKVHKMKNISVKITHKEFRWHVAVDSLGTGGYLLRLTEDTPVRDTTYKFLLIYTHYSVFLTSVQQKAEYQKCCVYQQYFCKSQSSFGGWILILRLHQSTQYVFIL